jgi:hypothetical protein
MCPYVQYASPKSSVFIHKRYAEEDDGIAAEIKTIPLLKKDVTSTTCWTHSRMSGVEQRSSTLHYWLVNICGKVSVGRDTETAIPTPKSISLRPCLDPMN